MTLSHNQDNDAVVITLPALAKKREIVETEAKDAQGALVVVTNPTFKITSDRQYDEVVALVKEVDGKYDFFEDERKVATKPLNDEVKRINNWYRPALTAFKAISERGRQVMAVYIMEKRKLEVKLREEAAAAAQKVLAAAPNAAQQVKEIVKAGAAASQPKAPGVSVKPALKFNVKDPDKVPRHLCSPDPKKVGAWVEQYGLSNVPDGIEVWEDVDFSIRRA